MTAGRSAAPLIREAATAALRALRGVRVISAGRVIVLCYHRIGTPDPNAFCGYRPNFSASSEHFREQMRLVKTLLTPISISTFLASIERNEPLPEYPALVTFDDGYKDNGAVAWPIMRELGIPGLVFLATDHIGTDKPFLWDYAAYCFETTSLETATVPLLGSVQLRTPGERHELTSRWMAEVKKLEATDRWRTAEALASALGVSPSADAFSGLYLGWDEVKALNAEGLAFGGHTKSHPILSRTTVDVARDEIAGCQQRLTSVLGQPVGAFAYPNGSPRDYTAEHEKLTKSNGFAVAFSLNGGTSIISNIRERPTAIRRMGVIERDGILRFSAKLAKFMMTAK